MAPVATESTAHADGRVGRRIENYAGFWQKDLSKEAGQDTENRLANYTDVINGECFVSCRVVHFPLRLSPASSVVACWLLVRSGSVSYRCARH